MGEVVCSEVDRYRKEQEKVEKELGIVDRLFYVTRVRVSVHV